MDVFYVVNTGNEYGSDPLSCATVCLAIDDAYIKFVELYSSGEHCCVTINEYDPVNYKFNEIESWEE